MDEGFKEADVVIEGDYHTPVQEHAFYNLKPEYLITMKRDV